MISVIGKNVLEKIYDLNIMPYSVRVGRNYNIELNLF